MKKLLTLTSAIILLTLTTNAQNKKGLDIYLNGGLGKVSSGKVSVLFNFTSGLNAVIANKHFFSLQYCTGFSKSFRFIPNRIYKQSTKYICYGQREQIGRSVFFTQSIGIGITDFTLTGFQMEDSNDYSSFFSDLILKGTGKTVYSHYTENSICIPLNLEIDFSSRLAGLGISFNMLLMKYPSIGLSANLLLGKVHGKK
jgi:hypothetical protein